MTQSKHILKLILIILLLLGSTSAWKPRILLYQYTKGIWVSCLILSCVTLNSHRTVVLRDEPWVLSQYVDNYFNQTDQTFLSRRLQYFTNTRVLALPRPQSPAREKKKLEAQEIMVFSFPSLPALALLTHYQLTLGLSCSLLLSQSPFALSKKQASAGSRFLPANPDLANIATLHDAHVLCAKLLTRVGSSLS